VNAGFSNLATLKAYILGSVLNAATNYDVLVAGIGLGIAAEFEKYCGRSFGYVIGAQEVFPADRTEFILTRPPVAAVTGWAVKRCEADGFVARDLTHIHFINLANGIVAPHHEREVGPWHHQVQFTYTGGYWWPQLDVGDAGYPDTAPAGSTPLPNDLQLAWLLQCHEVWKKKDKFGQAISSDDETVVRISAANLQNKLLPQVESILAGYVRYSLV
jgi:hypothetical protein